MGNQSSPSTPSQGSTLVGEYARAKEAYDEALELVLSLGKLNMESAKVAARRRIKAQGFRDPDVIRWDMRFKLGAMVEEE